MKSYQIVKILVSVLCLVPLVLAQNPTPTPSPSPNVVGEVTVTTTKANIDPIYLEFRKSSDKPNAFAGEYAIVNNLVLKRDAATFTLRSGEIYFLEPVQGKTTGAVFFGEGEITLTPPVESEKRMLNYFTESTELKEPFTKLVMFFTDKTYNEVKRSPNVKMASNGPQSGHARDAYRDKESLLKNDFRYNMAARILLDAYAPPRPGFFTTFIDGKKYNKLVYQLDPLGIPEVSPEQVMLYDYSSTSQAVLTAFHLADEYKKGTAASSTDRRIFDLTNHEINLAFKGTRMIASDKATLTMRIPGQRVIPFDLFPYLRVKRIQDEKGVEIDFIQEDKDRDGGLSVILPYAPEQGKPFILNFEYEGDEALRGVGSGNFFLIPRSTWYPNNAGSQFGDRATFDITFQYPKRFTLIGVGELVEPEKMEGDLKISHWSTKGVEMAVAGFNYGDFIKKEVIDPNTGYNLEAYANKELPAGLKLMLQKLERNESRGARYDITTGGFNTAIGAANVLTQAQNSVRIFDNYFGKLPHKRIAMTEQPAPGFGQAWPTLIYMPYTAYFDATTRTQLYGVDGGTDTFWKEVAAHEVSHQWWGHAVGWTSYHDQWMSEGFAQLSASLYIQYVKNDINEFIQFWEEQRERITQGSYGTKGIKPYTVGPITQGYRLNTEKTGRIAQSLIYPKGAFVLHMLRMMMYDHRKGTGDEKFKAMMKDFIQTHYNKDVSTEDFKAIVEKHITPQMDIDGNKKMDWFFDEWVYGTEVPAYKLEYQVTSEGGKNILVGKVTQSGVSDKFVMMVPIYVDYGKGWSFLGSATINGNSSVELKVPLIQVPKKVAVAPLHDVLATELVSVKK